jgi:hypothetical protein
MVLLTGLACTERGEQTIADSPEATDANPSAELAVAEGQLSRIDADADQLWVKMPDGSEMQFSYGMMTDVEGAAGQAEGLVGDVEDIKQGTQVRVHYRPGVDEDVIGDDDINNAIRIEVGAAA